MGSATTRGTSRAGRPPRTARSTSRRPCSSRRGGGDRKAGSTIERRRTRSSMRCSTGRRRCSIRRRGRWCSCPAATRRGSPTRRTTCPRSTSFGRAGRRRTVPIGRRRRRGAARCCGRRQTPVTGLYPDYSSFEGKAMNAPWEPKGAHDRFGSDAFRVGGNVAMDWLWFGADPWQVEQSDRMLAFLAAQRPRYVSGYTVGGKPTVDYQAGGHVRDERGGGDGGHPSGGAVVRAGPVGRADPEREVAVLRRPAGRVRAAARERAVPDLGAEVVSRGTGRTSP